MLFDSTKLFAADGQSSKKKTPSLSSIVFIVVCEGRAPIIQSPNLRQVTPPFVGSPRAFGPPIPKPMTEGLFDCRSESPLSVR